MKIGALITPAGEGFVDVLYYARSVRGMVSKMGWFSCTDSYDCYLANVKPYVDIRRLKRIISKLDKEDRQNDGMEERNLLNSAA